MVKLESEIAMEMTHIHQKINAMKRIFNHYEMKPGDEIVVPKSGFNLVQHYALYLGFDNLGTDWVIENNYKVGVRLITADTFFKSYHTVNKINPFFGNHFERIEIVQNALKKVGQPYNLINYNCQHFTSDVRTGMPKSNQVGIAAFSVLAIAILVAIAKD